MRGGPREARPPSRLEFEPAVPLSEQGPAPVRVVAGFGFWLFLLSDIILFSSAICGLCGAVKRHGRRT